MFASNSCTGWPCGLSVGAERDEDAPSAGVAMEDVVVVEGGFNGGET